MSVLNAPGYHDVERQRVDVTDADWRTGVQHTRSVSGRDRSIGLHTLRWENVGDGLRAAVRDHYRAYVAGGSVPFAWTPPGGVEMEVRYQARPRFARRGPRQVSIVVTLEEAVSTD